MNWSTGMLRLIILALIGFPLALQASDLMDIYQQALTCDPTFKAAYAELLVNRENIPINRSLLFPKVDFHGQATRERIDVKGVGVVSIATTQFQNNITSFGVQTTQQDEVFYNNTAAYYLTVKQPIFNYESFARLKYAKVSVKAAEARFCASVQDLIVRVAKAYLDVIESYDYVQILDSEKKALQTLLDQNKTLLKAQLAPITNVYEVQARHDVVESEQIGAEIDLTAKLEKLRKIVGCLPCTYRDLSHCLPMVHPEPENIECWVQTALRQNFEILAACYESLAAKENIEVQVAGHFPVINAVGQYSYINQSNPAGDGFGLKVKELLGGVAIDWSIYRGGEVLSRTQQAAYQYKKADFEREGVLRTVVSDTREIYKRMVLVIRKIEVDKRAIMSGEKSVETTTQSYRAGIRTILDVLNTQTQLYQSQIRYTKDRYNYVLSLLLLKKAIGTLCVNDLMIINSWLCPEINLSPYI